MSISACSRVLIAAVSGGLVAGAVTAVRAEDYFAGKMITVNVGLPPGGGYDIYARHMIHYWRDHIPGKPTMIVQNRPGAGSVLAANYVYSVAPKDGTHLALTLNVTPVFQVFGVSGVRYDIGKIAWIGNMVNLSGLLVVWHTSPAKTMEEVRQREIIVGTTGGKQGEAFIYAVMMKAFTGAKFKIAGGYGGTAALDPAMERGEIHGRSAAWNSYIISRPDWIENKRIIPLVQVGLKKDKDLPHVPLVTEFATSEDGRKVLELISSAGAFTRAFWGPPEMPKEALDILRSSFDATLKDPKFLADSQKRKFEIDPNSGAEVEAIAKKMLMVPKQVVDTAKAALEAN
jgi:tripartite-type tricarboxylate transporter receptor subunit TctC